MYYQIKAFLFCVFQKNVISHSTISKCKISKWIQNSATNNKDVCREESEHLQDEYMPKQVNEDGK